MISLADFRQKTAFKLGIISQVGSLSAEDGDVFNDKITALQKTLAERDLLHIIFDEGIDELYLEPLSSMVAAMCVNEFGVPEPQRTTLINEGLLDLPVSSLAERQLRKIVAGRTILKPVKVDYF